MKLFKKFPLRQKVWLFYIFLLILGCVENGRALIEYGSQELGSLSGGEEINYCRSLLSSFS